MKNALILHGTDADHTSHWFSWLGEQLEQAGYKAWVPDLPGADYPSIERYNDFLLSSEFEFSQETIIVGHSSGAVEVLGLLNDERFKAVVKACFMVGVFEGDLGWDKLVGMKADFDYEAIKSKSKRFVVIHSDNDPHCPLEGAKRIAGKLEAEFIMIPGQGHFSAKDNAEYVKFPKLLKIVEETVL
ncbi:hypothetical protein EPO04_04105 [Patescibacteria group bacterium]|nr:MAG: hypothetical protein EPO04_04105 [Patescibacteria group bacterium]